MAERRHRPSRSRGGNRPNLVFIFDKLPDHPDTITFHSMAGDLKYMSLVSDSTSDVLETVALACGVSSQTIRSAAVDGFCVELPPKHAFGSHEDTSGRFFQAALLRSEVRTLRSELARRPPAEA